MKCYKGGKQHKFRPRYDEVPMPNGTKVKIDPREDFKPSSMRRMLIRDVYVCDICEWCGEKISRNEDV